MTVTRRNLHLGLATLVIGLIAATGCSDNPSAPGETPGNVSVESSHQETGTIGVDGGTISTTSGAGVTYTLAVPPGAFAGDVEVTITPISALRNLPFTGRLEGGVRLGPSGLRLLKPAVLTIGKAPSTGGAEQLVGFLYEGDAESYQPAAALETGGEIRVFVSHFSGAGAASGEQSSTIAWLAVLCASAPTLNFPFASQLDACWRPPQPKREWFLQFARDYLEDIVAPLVQSGDLSVGVTEWIEWSSGCEELAEAYEAEDYGDVLAPVWEPVVALVEQKLVAAIAAEKSALCAQGGGERLRLVFEYKHLADLAGLGGKQGLRDEDILQGLCAEVSIPELTLPANMPVGTDHSLDMRAELLVNGQREDALFRVELVVDNGTCNGGQGCNGNTNGLGEYTAVIRRTGDGPVDVLVEARLLMTLFIPNGGASGYAPVATLLWGHAAIRRAGIGMSAAMPSPVLPYVPVDVEVVVADVDILGNVTPVLAAVVTFAAVGGSLSSSTAFTDSDGFAQVSVTPAAGPGTLEVTVTATVDGILIGSTVLTSPITSGGGITISRTRVIAETAVGCGSQYCAGSCEPEDESEAPGPGEVSASSSSSVTCDYFGAISNRGGSAFASFSTSVAADGQSALMSLTTAISAQASVTGDGEAEANARSGGAVSFAVVGDPVEFTLTLSAGGTFNGAFIQRDDNTNVFVWTTDDAASGGIYTGTLPPGSYSFVGNSDTTARANASDPSGSASATLGAALELTVVRATAARSAQLTE